MSNQVEIIPPVKQNNPPPAENLTADKNLFQFRVDWIFLKFIKTVNI